MKLQRVRHDLATEKKQQAIRKLVFRCLVNLHNYPLTTFIVFPYAHNISYLSSGKTDFKAHPVTAFALKLESIICGLLYLRV